MGVKIDRTALRAYLDEHGLTYKAAGELCMRSNSFVNNIFQKGTTSDTGYAALCNGFGVPYGTFKEKEAEPVNAAEPEVGFTLSLQVKPDRVRVGVNFNGAEIYNGYSRVNGDTELDLMQAISYAAHMIYKFAEQRVLAEE